jgi:hypothetical protein
MCTCSIPALSVRREHALPSDGSGDGHAGAARAGDGDLRHALRAAGRAELRLRPRQFLHARHARAGNGRYKASRWSRTT